MAGDTNARSEAIGAFVERLTQVREQAGRPSFREMARRSGAISHATLHDALQGVRMPSWETTVEFAKACDTDPQELRAEWEQAESLVRADSPGCGSDPETEEAAAGAASETATTDRAAPATREPSQHTDGDDPTQEGAGSQPPSRGKRLLGLGIGIAAVAVIATFGVLLLTREAPSEDASPALTGEAAAAYSSAPNAPSTTTSADGCPENVEVNPGPAPRVDGDESHLADDVRIPDCSTQPRGHSLVKTWELANTGTVEWKGRFLHRINVHEGSPGCRAPERVAIPDTSPGETVEVSVTIATPDHDAICFGRWMQTDSKGNFTFPQQRPYFYTFKVR